MAKKAYLGLDLGTSGLRGLLTDGSGSVLASAEADYDVSRPLHGWSEQDPADWIMALDQVMVALQKAAPNAMAGVQGIGVAGHMHGAVLLDKTGDVLRPCILWNDTRSFAEAAELDTIDQVRAVSGNIVFPGFTAPKLMWVHRHEPDIFEAIEKVLLPAAYLNFYLTGAYVGDLSDAAGTSWLDTGARNWSDTMLAASGMHHTHMPRLVEGSEPAAPLRDSLANKWSLPKGIIVAGGAGDNAAAACGVGALNEGDGFVSLGTSGVVLAARDHYAPDPATAVHTFCHAVPGRWYQMGVILAATDCLNWLSRQIGQSPASLTNGLGDDLGPPVSLQFLPYLSGERTPHNDSRIRGAFVGLDVAHTPHDLTRAVLQGVSFALADSLDALTATGADLQRLIAIGGGSDSKLWLQMLATVLNLPIDVPEKGEFGAAMGAARLAICAATGANPDTVMTKPTIAQTIMPNADLTDAYAKRRETWAKIYPALKDLS